VTRENTTLILDTDTAPFNQLKPAPAPAAGDKR
jgi:hypothetical protein